MKKLLRLVCSVVTLLAMVVLLTAQNNRHEGSKCSLGDLSKISSRHLERLQRIIDRIHYTNPGLKYWETQVPHFNRRLLMWGFYGMDRNRNGLIDHNEGSTLPGSKICKEMFIKMCDKDQSRSVSPQEWLDCFKMPACNEKCLRGKLDKIRCECRCATNVIQGRVMSLLGIPLREARILSAPAPYTQLARTNRSGHFSMTETCSSSQSYTVKKDGYIPVEVEGRSWGATPLVLIHLEDAEPPSIIIHPKSKVRLNGQSANFTCKAEGTAPFKIYWYKNGKILLKENVGSVSSLFIADATDAQGFYTCKAVNDYGSEISNKAVLTVEEPSAIEDTCTSTPSKHVLELRSGCAVPSTGEDRLILDIGRCSNEPCAHRDLRSGISMRCAGTEDCCCGPVETSKVEIKCGPTTMNMERVTKCGCTSCIKRETELKGVVLGGPLEEPISKIRVIFKKKIVAVSDKEGKFSLIVPEDEDRLTVTFQDPNDRYFDTTMTLPFQRGQIVFHKVTLQLEDPPVEFDSTQELKVAVGHAEENMAELEIPANNLLQRDGTPYKGKAKLRVRVTDPRNATDLLSAPGDFTTVDQFGNVQPLKTYGMLRIKVEDESSQQLSLADNVKLYLDANMIKLPQNATGEMAPRLWWLDEKTSRWRYMGQMRPKEPNITRNRRELSSGRRFYIGEIQTDRISVVNIDIEWRRCYVRAEVFAEVEGSAEPVDGVTISLIGREDEDQEQYYGYTQAVTNQNGVACIPAWCDSIVYLQASRMKFDLTEDKNLGTKISYPVPDNITLQRFSPGLSVSIVEGNQTNSFRFIAKVSSSDGPIFRGDEFNKCFDPVNNATAFRFYARKLEKAEEFNDFGFRPKGHPLAWYTTDPKLPGKEVKRCFVKIKTASDKDMRSALMISVESYTPDRKERYGFSVKQSLLNALEPWPTNETANWSLWEYPHYKENITCVEYRCSEPGKETFIKVMTLSDQCYTIDLIPALIDDQPIKLNSTFYERMLVRSFYAPAEVSDGKLGLYSGLGNSAEKKCLHGSVDREGDVKIISDGYAVFVFDPLECPWEGILSWTETGTFP